MEKLAVPQKRGRPRKRPGAVAGDKAYDCKRIRDWLKRHGIKSVIPKKSNAKKRRGRPVECDPGRYRRRNVIERCVGWLKENRRIATRYDKLGIRYAAMLTLAMIKRYFRVLDLSDTA